MRHFFSMKSVEMFQGEMHNYGADNGNTVFLGTSLRTMSLSDKGGTYNVPGFGFNLSMGSSVVVVIFGMLSFILVIAFLVLILCRRTTIVERTTTFRRQVTNGNGRGLERAVIESFPVFSYGLVRGLKSHEAKGSECTVCLSDFADEEMVRLLPKCSHAFHPECIDTWLCSNTTCPVCRISLTSDEDPGVPAATAEPRTTPEQVVIVVDNGNNEAPAETSDDWRGHSLVRVRREMEQGTEWCISTATGLKPGLRKSFSFSGHRLFQKPRNLNFAAAEAKPGGSVGDAGQGSRSEGWGAGSMNVASFLRSFSER